MELETLMAQVLTEDKIKAIAKKANLTPKQTLKVVAAALPVLLEGAQQQNSEKATQEGFAKAVRSHAVRDPEQVDALEGEKIVNHLLSNDTTAVKAISKKTGLTQKQVLSILAVLAPIIMNLLGSSTQQQAQSGNNTTDLISNLLGVGSGSGNSMAGVLLNMLAGSAASSAANASSNSSTMTGLLGSLLGGNSSSSNTSALAGAVLGSLLGGSDNAKEDKEEQKDDDDDDDDGVDMLSLLMGLLK